MRGTDSRPGDKRPSRRFIPAHAGNRPTSPQPRARRTVHPRACGEQGRCLPRRRSAAGSSPRMRGTGSLAPSPTSETRFIPAHAGNRVEPWMLPHLLAVHPRACGEQTGGHQQRVRHCGSSPRMRGTEFQTVHLGGGSRFIPAHAGNRRLHRHSAQQATVHPRACGEQGFFLNHARSHPGSSPRMRGTAPRAGRAQDARRFIPAHAGNSRSGPA